MTVSVILWQYIAYMLCIIHYYVVLNYMTYGSAYICSIDKDNTILKIGNFFILSDDRTFTNIYRCLYIRSV